MLIPRRTQIILALIVSSVFLFQSCATLIPRTSQKIPVTSNPLGAKIIVNGKELGHTPLNLELKKNKSHIIRIEKHDYNPLEIILTQKTSIPLTAMSLLRIGFAGAAGVAIGGISTIDSHGDTWVNQA